MPDAVERTSAPEAVEYVTIPDKTFTGYAHPGLRINERYFGAGTHAVSPVIAQEMREILARFDEQEKRLLLPDQDPIVIKHLAKGGAVVVRRNQ